MKTFSTVRMNLSNMVNDMSKGFATFCASWILVSSAGVTSELEVNSPIPPASAATTLSALKQDENKIINLFKETVPSVVYINTFVAQRDVFSMDILQVPQGTGSGLIWNQDGYVVTNFHVIRNSQAATVTVTGKDGKTRTDYKAKVVGVDPDKDIAVLKIEPEEPIVPIKKGCSADLNVGQYSFALGNPFGLDHSLTTGIISGLGREMRSPTGRPITNCIQTDAAINPGNSGGALLDSDGALIGMNTAIYSLSGASAGIGFAIPVDTMKVIVDSIIRTGTVTRAQIGISYLESSQARALGIAKGVLVLDVPKDSVASAAGLRGTNRSQMGYIELGDIIIAIDDDAINNESDLFKILDKHAPGDDVTLSIVRLNPKTGEFDKQQLNVKLKAKEQSYIIKQQQ